MSHIQPISASVRQAFEAISSTQRTILLQVREMIFDVAQAHDDIGLVEETLRWGEPAYLVTTKRTGSTIRLAVEKTSGKPALLFNCKTTLVEEFRQQFGTSLTFVKNRAVILDGDLSEKTEALKMYIEAALSYYLRPLQKGRDPLD